jgi:hypothetical protein
METPVRDLKAMVPTLVASVALALAIGGVRWNEVAEAHDTCVQHGADVACAKDNHSRLDACDRESDGHKVRGHFTTPLSDPSYYHGSWDPNGANPDCAHDWPATGIVRFRVCEEVEGCSAWKFA